MIATATKNLSIQASDATGQKRVRVSDAGDGTIGQLVDRLLPDLDLPAEVQGLRLNYVARLEREGRHLHASERVSDALQVDDEIMIAPSIDAG